MRHQIRMSVTLSSMGSILVLLLTVVDLGTRRNQSQKILFTYWMVTCQNQSRDRIFWFWFLLVRKLNMAFVARQDRPEKLDDSFFRISSCTIHHPLSLCVEAITPAARKLRRNFLELPLVWGICRRDLWWCANWRAQGENRSRARR